MKRYSRWVAAMGLVSVLLLCSAAMAEEVARGGTPTDQASANRMVGLGLAAGLTMALCVIGASYAVGRIGSAAIGAAAEKPELLTRTLLFVALAEGLAVLGFAFGMMILQKM